MEETVRNITFQWNGTFSSQICPLAPEYSHLWAACGLFCHGLWIGKRFLQRFVFTVKSSRVIQFSVIKHKDSHVIFLSVVRGTALEHGFICVVVKSPVFLQNNPFLSETVLWNVCNILSGSQMSKGTIYFITFYWWDTNPEDTLLSLLLASRSLEGRHCNSDSVFLIWRR